MTVQSVDTLVERALSRAPDQTEDGLRSAAIDVAFDMKLDPPGLSSLLTALEKRTGTKLERRAIPRAPVRAKSTAKR